MAIERRMALSRSADYLRMGFANRSSLRKQVRFDMGVHLHARATVDILREWGISLGLRDVSR